MAIVFSAIISAEQILRRLFSHYFIAFRIISPSFSFRLMPLRLRYAIFHTFIDFRFQFSYAITAIAHVDTREAAVSH